MIASTRSQILNVTPSLALINGISSDGGLYVTTQLPNLTTTLDKILHYSYQDLCTYILSLFFSDIPVDDIKSCVAHAYKDNFKTSQCVSYRHFDTMHIAELYHGPTHAFKDFALTLLPHLLSKALEINAIDKKTLILTATSGDTGKAALEGFKNLKNIDIIVFFPTDGVSKVQEQQMITQIGENTCVVAIKGNFDDAQSGVKGIFSDEKIKAKLSKYNYVLSSANSINIGRLIPQIVYYFHSYFTLVRNKKIAFGDEINFAVPTGNFGNILAGYYAKKMGLPIHNLICASNKNNVLTEFLTTGIYDKNRNFHTTISPSMDILISSNLERLLYHISDESNEKVNVYMKELQRCGRYKIDEDALKKMTDFKAYFASETETKNSIKAVYQTLNYLIDPHTAVAYHCYQTHLKKTHDNRHTVILSTASPYKFTKSVCESIGIDTTKEDAFDLMYTLAKNSNTTVPKNLNGLKKMPVLHKKICHVNEMPKIVLDYVRSQ